MDNNENKKNYNMQNKSSENSQSLDGLSLAQARVDAMLDEIKSTVEKKTTAQYAASKEASQDLKAHAVQAVKKQAGRETVAASNKVQAKAAGLSADAVSRPAPAATALADEGAAVRSEGRFLDAYANIDTAEVIKIDPELARQKKIKTLLWSGIAVLSIIILAIIIALAWNKDEPLFKTDSPPPVTVFNPGNVFGDSLKPYEADDVVFPEGIQERFKTAYAARDNLVGWLRVPSTSIDMPIYKSKRDSDYLFTDLWGNYSPYGVVYMDRRNEIDPLSKNTVIYGHNYDRTDDGRFTDLQFGEIEQYRDLEFYKQNPVIEFDTLFENHKWKVFACIVTNGAFSGDLDGDSPYIFAYHWTHMSDASFEKMIDELHQRSFIHTDVDVLPSDKILTLSTCTYYFDRNGREENARCALVARMVREGESEEVDVSMARENENIRFPQLYYDVFGGTNPHRNTEKWYPEG